MPLLDDAVGYDLVDGESITAPNQLRQAMKGCEQVIHLAGIPGPVPGTKIDSFWQVNVQGTRAVVKMAVECGVRRLIFASSTAYYGVEDGIDFEAPVVEGNAPFTAYVDSVACEERHLGYSISKIIAEQVLAFYGLSRQIEVVIFRFGPLKPGRGTSPETAAKYIQRALFTEDPQQYEIYNVVDNFHPWAITEKVRCTFGQ